MAGSWGGLDAERSSSGTGGQDYVVDAGALGEQAELHDGVVGDRFVGLHDKGEVASGAGGGGFELGFQGFDLDHLALKVVKAGAIDGDDNGRATGCGEASGLGEVDANTGREDEGRIEGEKDEQQEEDAGERCGVQLTAEHPGVAREFHRLVPLPAPFPLAGSPTKWAISAEIFSMS